MIRGVPQNKDDWFGYNVEIELNKSPAESAIGEDLWNATVIRIPSNRPLRPIQGLQWRNLSLKI